MQHYLVEMLSKKFTMNRNAIDRLNDDIEKLRLFFTNWEVKDKLVVSRIQILRDFVELFLSEPDAMGSLFRRMLENSPDLTQPIIEHALLLRDDLDRGQVKNVLARFKEIKERLPNREVPADGSNRHPTVFSLFSQTTSYRNFFNHRIKVKIMNIM